MRLNGAARSPGRADNFGFRNRVHHASLSEASLGIASWVPSPIRSRAEASPVGAKAPFLSASARLFLGPLSIMRPIFASLDIVRTSQAEFDFEGGGPGPAVLYVTSEVYGASQAYVIPSGSEESGSGFASEEEAKARSLAGARDDRPTIRRRLPTLRIARLGPPSWYSLSEHGAGSLAIIPSRQSRARSCNGVDRRPPRVP
jgi:hypothetical protein